MGKFSFFSLKWMTSEERKHQQEKRAIKQAKIEEEKKLLRKDDEAQESLVRDWDIQGLKFEVIKPYKSCRVIGDTLLVVLNDGTTLAKDDLGILGEVRQAQTEDDIIQLFTKYQKREEEDDFLEDRATVELIANNLEVFEGNADFEIVDRKCFLKGVKLVLPAVVTATFITILEQIQEEKEK